MQVKVLVNGNPIPFDVKIGEAGEAFFVFETENDTGSPLEVMQPGQSELDVQQGRFGTKENEERQ